MSAVSYVGQAKGLVRNLERRERDRNGGTLIEARNRIARAMGVMPGTLYNLAYDRLKRIDETFRARLSDYAIKDIEHELASLHHELAMARALGAFADPQALRRLEAVIAEATALLAETTGERS